MSHLANIMYAEPQIGILIPAYNNNIVISFVLKMSWDASDFSAAGISIAS
jgi:hypothetical protein